MAQGELTTVEKMVADALSEVHAANPEAQWTDIWPKLFIAAFNVLTSLPAPAAPAPAPKKEPTDGS